MSQGVPSTTQGAKAQSIGKVNKNQFSGGGSRCTTPSKLNQSKIKKGNTSSAFMTRTIAKGVKHVIANLDVSAIERRPTSSCNTSINSEVEKIKPRLLKEPTNFSSSAAKNQNSSHS